MKQIKYIFLSAIICIAGIALVLQSCNNENGLSSSDSASKIVISTQYDYLDLPKGYQQIGQFHNEGLDTVFTEVNKVLYATSMQAKVKVKVKGSLQYVQTSLKSLDYNSIIENALQKYGKSNAVLSGYHSSYPQSVNYHSKRSLVKGSSDSTIVLDNLNPQQKELMDSIYSALATQDPNASFAGLKNKLNKINKIAEHKLKKEDVACIYAASSVAYCSFQYWRKNMGKWANMFLAYNLGGEKCKELAKANKLKMSKSQRFKAPSTFELADGSWVVEIYLDDVVVTSNTFWGSVVLPTIKADGSSAGVAAVYAAAQAWYITEYSGGELAPEAGAAALNQIFSAAGQASAVMGLYYIMNY